MKLYLFRRSIFSIKRFLSVLIAVTLFLSLSSCTEKTTKEKYNEVAEIKIIPSPTKILYKRGHFKLYKTTRILLNLSDEVSKNSGKYLIDKILEKTNYKLKIADRFTTKKISSGIEIILGDFKEIKPEGFKVVVSSNRIKIVANDLSGVYYASNVIISLIHKNTMGWNSPQISIEDYPKIITRGVYINFDDSSIDKIKLLQVLKKNRINYLVTPQKWELASNSLLNIQDTASLPTNWVNNLVTNTSIKSFYKNNNHSNDSLLFEITNAALLLPDSLAILGESVWTKANKLDYKNLIKHLERKSEH